SFFFSSRRRHTRFSRDWSSDVCSSDLERVRQEDFAVDQAQLLPYFSLDRVLEDGVFRAAHEVYGLRFTRRDDLPAHHPQARVWEIGRASCRERVWIVGVVGASTVKT